MLDKMRRVELGPVVLAVIVLVLASLAAYMFWLRPSMQQAQIEREWTSPEAVARRGPGGKTQSDHFRESVERIRAKRAAEGMPQGLVPAAAPQSGQ